MIAHEIDRISIIGKYGTSHRTTDCMFANPNVSFQSASNGLPDVAPPPRTPEKISIAEVSEEKHVGKPSGTQAKKISPLLALFPADAG